MLKGGSTRFIGATYLRLVHSQLLVDFVGGLAQLPWYGFVNNVTCCHEMLAHHSRSVSVVEAYRLGRINELLTDLVLVVRRLWQLRGLRDRR